MIPRADLLEEIHRLADDGTPPTYREMDQHGEYSAQTYRRRFGTWNDALRAAGYEPNEEQNIQTDTVLKEIQRLADGETPPTQEEMTQHGGYGARTYRNRFGTWNDALRAAGYEPNKEQNIGGRKLLSRLAEDVSGSVAPSNQEFNGTYDEATYRNRFGSWWQAVVQAGLVPRTRRPLTDHQFEQMVAAAHSLQKPLWKLTALLHLFTGVPATYVSAITADRVTTHAGGTVVTIPGTETRSGSDWEFKLPAMWGSGRDTELPGLLDWYLSYHERVSLDQTAAGGIIYRTARNAGIERPTTDTRVGAAPDVTPGDLRATGGARMARNEEPPRRIRRHLGIEHTGWDAGVEDFFLWNYVHRGHEHPDYDPPDVVFDPVV